MKKTILLLLTLTLILCIFVSCDKVAEHDLLDKTNFETSSAEMTSTSTLKTETTGTETSNSSSENNQNASNETQTDTLSNETSESLKIETPDIERPLLSLWTENEYTEFLDSTDLPDDFVSYAKIESIGDFSALVFLSDAYRGDYSSYMYSLVDSEGFEMSLYVDHGERNLITQSPISNVNKTNMREQLDTSKGVYVFDNIKYSYLTEGLLSISWQDQDITYCLSSVNQLFSKYPLTEATFVGKMLNTETAHQTLNTVFSEASK